MRNSRHRSPLRRPSEPPRQIRELNSLGSQLSNAPLLGVRGASWPERRMGRIQPTTRCRRHALFRWIARGTRISGWECFLCCRHSLADDCRFRKIHRSRHAERMCKSSPVARTRFRPAKRFSLSSARRGKGLARHIVRSQARLLNATFGRDA